MKGKKTMSISVQQPQPYDLVTDEVQVAGTAGGAFEATLGFEITQGKRRVTGSFMAGDGTGGHGQFQFTTDVSGAGFTQSKAFVRVFVESMQQDGDRFDEVVVPVLLGAQIVPGYTVYDEYVVQRGDTLSRIAAEHLGAAADYPILVAANEPTIPNPNVISVGQIIRIPR